MTEFLPKNCRRALRRLDDFLSGELTVESKQEILHHLETCDDCSRERELRQRLRSALVREWSSRSAPPALVQQVREELGDTRRPAMTLVAFRWAAGVILAVAAFMLFSQLWLPVTVEAVNHFREAIHDHVECENQQHAALNELPIPPTDLLRAERSLHRQVHLAGELSFWGHFCEKEGVRFIHYKYCLDNTSAMPCSQGEKSFSLVLEERRKHQHFAERNNALRQEIAGVPVLVFEEGPRSVVALESESHFVYIVADEIDPPPFALPVARAFLPQILGSLSNR